MSRLNIEYNGKWACFSSIVDSFITPFMDKESYDKWRKKEYGIYHTPIKEHNTITIKEAVSNIRLNRDSEETLKILIDSGISENEAKTFVNEINDKHYRPKLVNGTYICPNCGRIVQKDQERCNDEACWIRFVW